ncbi:MAG: HEPN domain-containing protein [Chitinivibrionales bacterium]|nr:HEPN domain-containing protein [Chitinivibrionales bacterium]
MDKYLAGWLEKAAMDITAARHLRKTSDASALTETICFHCQQAVEKYLKAFLVSKNISFKKIHNLEVLLQMCVSADTDFNTLDMGNLSDYAVTVRYPGHAYSPTINDADQSLLLADKIRSFVNHRIPGADDFGPIADLEELAD